MIVGIQHTLILPGAAEPAFYQHLLSASLSAEIRMVFTFVFSARTGESMNMTRIKVSNQGIRCLGLPEVLVKWWVVSSPRGCTDPTKNSPEV